MGAFGIETDAKDINGRELHGSLYHRLQGMVYRQLQSYSLNPSQ
ncbi:hypothetical protein LBYZC6_31190 [Lacrimispora brassicae]